MSADTVGARLTEAAGRAGVFLRDGDESVTYAEFDALTDRVAAGLLARGVGPGDRIGLLGLNRPDWLAAFFGAAKIGVVVVTLNVRYRDAELGHMLGQSGARLVIGLAAVPDYDFAGYFARTGIPAVHFGPAFDELAATTPDPAGLRQAKQRVGAADPLMILYTSGTTGRPKGAVITHGSILAAASAQAVHCALSADDVLLGHLPLNHVGGITCTVMAALVSGATVALLPAFSPDGALRAVERHRVTFLGAVPTMYVLMLGRPDLGEYDLSSVRVCTAGGSNVEPALVGAIRKAFPGALLMGLYGLSECSGACVMSHPDDDPDTVSRALGVMLGGFEARVVDHEGTALPAGETGELQVRGGCVAAGYWELPDETAEVFGPGGWLATGDMVVLEPDGHLVLRGRKKEMYIQGGFNVYPVEIENVLTTHPGVAMAAGIGVADPVLGEVGRYYVMPRAGAAPTAEELTAYCRERLADYKVPRQFVITTELPLTPIGKIQKSALRGRP